MKSHLGDWDFSPEVRVQAVTPPKRNVLEGDFVMPLIERNKKLHLMSMGDHLNISLYWGGESRASFI